jgi:hypothetical protein
MSKTQRNMVLVPNKTVQLGNGNFGRKPIGLSGPKQQPKTWVEGEL